MRSWTAEVGRPGAIWCELVSLARRRHDDRKHLAEVVRRVLKADLQWPVTDVFSECSQEHAFAYLERGLRTTQAYRSPLMPPAWVAAFQAELEALVPAGVRWYTNDDDDEVLSATEILNAQSRGSCPVVADRTFESLVAGVADDWAFFFYAWDED